MKRISSPKARRGRKEVAKARGKVVAARAEMRQAQLTGEPDVAEKSLRTAEEELEKTIHDHALDEVRPVEVYEHADLLDDALTNATERVLVISPWIRAGVVNQAFLKKLESLLRRSVRVAIGYGLGVKDEDERPQDAKAREALHVLAHKFPHLIVRRLGDTHAKVLIKDREFYVISSFNWLSFRGDRSRTFREELGTFVAIPQRVDELFERLVARLGSVST